LIIAASDNALKIEDFIKASEEMVNWSVDAVLLESDFVKDCGWTY
jgi:hypothetical protein